MNCRDNCDVVCERLNKFSTLKNIFKLAVLKKAISLELSGCKITFSRIL